MTLLSKTVEMKWNPKNKNHFIKLGYNYTKMGDVFICDIKDLSKGSQIQINIKCDGICGNKFLSKYGDYIKCVHNDGKYYCRKCVKTLKETKEKMSKARIGKYTGKNSPNWNSEITDQERTIKRNYPEYIEWTKKVMARDDYICQCCGKKDIIGNNLNAHHLDGYDWCKEKRTDETNGITLCKTCHKNFHSIYGYGNNTKEQFEEWIGCAIEVVKFEGELIATRKIYCIEENKVYDSAEILAKEWSLKSKFNIYTICNHVRRLRKKKEKLKNGECKMYEYYSEPKTLHKKHLLWLEEAKSLGYIEY